MDEKEGLRSRIKLIMEREQLNNGAFAESIGVAQATISQIMKGRNMPSTDVLLRLHQRYPDVSLDWLLTGKESGATNETAENDENFREYGYTLFDKDELFPSNEPKIQENRKEIAFKTPQNTSKSAVIQDVIYKEKRVRKITEIRIFFDDNTYETFSPSK